MDNSIYVTLSGQLALFRDMDVTANNLANANTSGYNADRLLFNSYVTKDINQGDRNPMALADNISTYRDTSNGSMTVTGNQLDAAIQGNAYFTIETPLGIRYTRAGSFQIDGDGTLVTPEGYPVLDNSNQHIVLPDNTTSVDIGSAGNIKVNGEDFTNLGIAQFDNPQLLERLSGKLYKSDIAPQTAENVQVLQGTIESSNVQPVLELTHMISISRAVENTSQFISIVYDLERKAADAWAQQS